MSPKRLFRRLLKYLILVSPLVIGMFFLFGWIINNNDHSSDKKSVRISFPSDSVFTDLDRAIMDKKAHQLDSIFHYLHKRIGFNGCVLYAEQGRKVYEAAFGYADYDLRTKLETGSAFQLASVSKMFTAMAIMILKEEGRLDYDDSLKYYIPELPYPGVTIRHLLVHRSGIPNYMYLADDYWDRGLSMTNDEMIGMLVSEKPRRYFSPNTGFHYCNTNYALLATVVERISGNPFGLFLQYKIFEPLGMNETYVYQLPKDSLARGKVPTDVCGHVLRRSRLRTEVNYYLNGIIGDKNVISTVGDMFTFDQALYEGTLVSDSTLQEAFSKGSPRFSRFKDNYGFGWRLKANRENTVYHFGWWKGFRTYYIRDMAQQKTIIVLTNTDRGPSSTYYYKMLDDHTYELGPVSTLPL
jgi:CubicO group peptidase (beta-lactamase class C family)